MKTSKATQDVNTMIFRFLLLSILTLTALSSVAKPVLLDQVAAIVDDDVIMNSSLEQRIQQIKSQNTNNQLPNDAALRKQRSEEHTSELQSRPHLVCRLLLEKKKKNKKK